MTTTPNVYKGNSITPAIQPACVEALLGHSLANSKPAKAWNAGSEVAADPARTAGRPSLDDSRTALASATQTGSALDRTCAPGLRSPRDSGRLSAGPGGPLACEQVSGIRAARPGSPQATARNASRLSPHDSGTALRLATQAGSALDRTCAPAGRSRASSRPKRLSAGLRHPGRSTWLATGHSPGTLAGPRLTAPGLRSPRNSGRLRADAGGPRAARVRALDQSSVQVSGIRAARPGSLDLARHSHSPRSRQARA